MSITEVFKKIGAPLANQRWSWGGVCKDGTVVLRVWQDRKKKIDGRLFMMVTHHEKFEHDQDNLGYQERNRHVELIKNGARCFMVMCLVKDVEASPRTISSFNKKEIFIGGTVIESEGDWWVEMIDRRPISEIANHK